MDSKRRLEKFLEDEGGNEKDGSPVNESNLTLGSTVVFKKQKIKLPI